MNEEQLIATLQACYFGDRGAFNKILKEYKQLQQELTDYKERNEKAIELLYDYGTFNLNDKYGNVFVKLLETLDKKDFNDMTHLFDNATSIEPFKEEIESRK